MKVLLLAFFVFFSTLSAPPAVAGKALSKKSTKQRSAARGPIVVRLNSPAAADQSHVIDTSLEQGCLTNEQKRLLTWQLGVEEQELQHFLLDANPLGLQTRGKDCLHYASAVAPKGDVNSLAVLSRASTTDQPIALFMSKSANEDKPVIRRLELPLSSLALTEVHLPASDLDTLPVEHIEKIPMHLRWELGLLVRRMIAGLDASEAHQLRIVLEKIPERALEKVLAVELIDTLRGKVEDRVIWFERADQRGAFFSTASGTDYARMLWYSPTRHVNISRGVGESVTTVRRKVATHAHGKKKPRFKTRRFSYRGQHIGIDFVAPAGTPVHAVADAEVVFASTMGGYGNLVILSHGQGYETYYAHLSGFAPDLVPGKKVLRGEEIAYVGSTGLSTGPHLHYELRKEKRYINPFDEQAALEFWNLQPEEHEQMLALMLVLDLTREVDDNAEQAAGHRLPLSPASGQFRVNYRAR